MRKEAKAQAKVGVGVEVLWRVLAKDMKLILPKIVPNLVREVEVLEGDGGLGTIMLFNFGSDISHMTYQKEKIAEFDESKHLIALQVIEGGHLDLGFASYQTCLQLTEIGEKETLIDITVAYDIETEDTSLPSKTTNSTLFLIKCLENYLLKNDI
ncbi:hypothetical protein HHK36_031789 [Tetracentron sinense]|uniref:Bet v I/Major latex protein domain-containing protein n=1 Tax=Tetracentron sinense TaxID=13715 RepID=A0A834Y912_TETSI|nr:hypothetical protein HHK36_031789 [Tetracentron sinense]